MLDSLKIPVTWQLPIRQVTSPDRSTSKIYLKIQIQTYLYNGSKDKILKFDFFPSQAIK